jgi:hypothetical protein
MAETNPSEQRAAPGQAPVAPPPKKADNEEPAMTLEADLPSDGRDKIGEAMIRACRRGRYRQVRQLRRIQPTPKPER